MIDTSPLWSTRPGVPYTRKLQVFRRCGYARFMCLLPRFNGNYASDTQYREFYSFLRFSAIVIIAVLHVARVVARHLVRTFSRFADACVCRTLFPAVHKMDVSRRLSDIHRAALVIAFRVGVPSFIRPRFERFAPARGLRKLAFCILYVYFRTQKEYTLRASTEFTRRASIASVSLSAA